MNQRRVFADTIYQLMKTNDRIVVIVGDLGYKVWDQVKEDYPDRFYNVGAAEVTMVNVAVGMALSGKIPICYSITPFLLWRPAEQLRIYVNHEEIPIILVGSGRDADYSHDGFTHDATDASHLLKILPNIDTFYPQEDTDVEKIARYVVKSGKPSFVSLCR